MNTMNPFQLINQLKSQGVDPRQILINMLSQNPNLDPVGKNMLDMAKNNDLNGATNIAKNISNEKGFKF